MLDYYETHEPYSSPEQCWAAAGWFVFIEAYSSPYVQKATACHKATGRIVEVIINRAKSDKFANQSWNHQVLNALIKLR